MFFSSPKEFFEHIKTNPDEARKTAFKIGQKLGLSLKHLFDIKGEDTEAVAKILHAAVDKEGGGQSIIFDDKNVTMVNDGFCPIMEAAQTLNIDLEWLDKNFAWPWFEGIVSVIRPNINLKSLLARSRGDKICKHAFEIC